MMQAGVCLRQDTETTLPELTEQHRIRQKEEELSGLESVHMAESETECAAPGLNTLEPECVTAHNGVSDVHHTHTSVIKTEADLGSTHTGDLIKTESLDFTELGYVTHLHPDQVKTETDDGGYLKAEPISDLQDFNMKSDKMKCESSERLVSDLMNTVMDGAGVEPWQCAVTNCTLPNTITNCTLEDVPTQCGDLSHHCNSGKHCVCSKCMQRKKSFHTKSNLNAHLRIHTGEKTYRCTQCEKCFHTTFNLNRHLRFHTGEKPYQCSLCGKCYSEKTCLTAHVRIHSGENPYTCTPCGKCFRTHVERYLENVNP